MVTDWGQEQAKAGALKDVSRTPDLQAVGDAADGFEWMLLGVHSVQYFVEPQM